MSDYNISAEITANTKGFESGVKKAQTASKNLGKSITNVVKGFGKGGLTGALTSAGLALGGIGIAVGATVKAVKGLVKVLDDCSDAYKVQLNAERALDTAINNSPYVTGSASKRLKEFASEMQKVSNMGDEELIPFMTQLIASGRTEAETMKIIKTASDMASSGAMSFDTAVTQLNATLNGNIGRLGQQNAELKELSAEELKNGKAVDILAEKYKGLTEATVDTKKQLKNAIGDLKESFGQSFEEAMAPMRKFFTELVQGWADARKARLEYEGAREAVASGTATDNQLVIYYEQQLKYIEDERKMYEGMYGADLQYAQAKLKELEMEKNKYKSLIATIKLRQKLEEEETQASEDGEQKIADLKDAYLKKMAEQEARWQNIKDVTGEEVKAEEKIKFYEDSLVDLMTQAGGEITTNNQLFKDQVAIIERLKATLQTPEEEDSDEWAEKLRVQAVERLKAEKEIRLQELENWGATEEAKYKITKEYNDKIYALELEGMERKKKVALKSVEGTANSEEQKRQIIDYYMKEQSSLMSEYNTQYVQDMGQTGSQMGQIFSQMFGSEIGSAMDNELAVMLMVVQKVGEEMKKVFAKVGDFIKNVFQKAVSFAKKLFSGFKNNLTKLFDFNPDTALDNLLKFEDKVLTFFIETLPKLPAFFESALQSISVMLSTIKLNIDKKKVKDLITNLLKTIRKYLPDILKIGLQIASEILKGLTEGIKENKETIGEILDMLVNIIAEYLPDIILGIINALGLFISSIKPETLVALVRAFVTLAKNICIAVIDNAVIIARELIPALFEVMAELFKKFPEILKEVLWQAIQGLGKVASTIWNVVKDKLGFATGTNNAPKGLALVGEAGPELVDFRGGERVINNRNTQKLLSQSGTGGNVFNVTFENTVDTTAFAMMKQLKQYQRNLAFNSVI